MGDREHWEERYRRGDASTTSEPTETLRRIAAELPESRALDVATGAASDALFLASQGYTVDALDISRVALRLAREPALEQGVSVNWIQADVALFSFPEATYDVINVSRFDARDVPTRSSRRSFQVASSSTTGFSRATSAARRRSTGSPLASSGKRARRRDSALRGKERAGATGRATAGGVTQCAWSCACSLGHSSVAWSGS